MLYFRFIFRTLYTLFTSPICPLISIPIIVITNLHTCILSYDCFSLAVADKLAHIEIATSELQEKNAVSREEISREKERNNQLQQRNKDLEYELSQVRARCEIYEMQVYEVSGELDKEKIASKEQQASHNRLLDEVI